MKRILSLIFIGMTLTACTPTVANRGNLVETYKMQEVVPGQDSKDDVIRKIGSPTTISPFDVNTWYYVGQLTEKKAMLDPKIKREKIYVVSFLPDGYVDKIVERRDGRKDVPIVDRVTPTSGNEFTFMQQMLGNLGRFNSAKQSAATTATGGNLNR
jgi:outer membrane protein assembly factor BamE (lipoprotein component of BamABCDE complex)